MSLEGGYDLPAICDSAEECVRALLGDDHRPFSQDELHRTPNQNAIDTLQKTIAVQVRSALVNCVISSHSTIRCNYSIIYY